MSFSPHTTLTASALNAAFDSKLDKAGGVVGSLDVRGTLLFGDGVTRIAAYADNSDSGVTIEAADQGNTAKKPIYLNPYGGAVSIGPGGMGVTNWYGLTPQLLVSGNQNAETIVGINNAIVGTNSSMTIRMIGGTANSYSISGLYDGNGSPIYRDNLGSGVLYRDWWLNGSQFMKLDNSGLLSIQALRVTAAATPASASAQGTAGQIAWDSGFIYVCVATNTWKRTALTTW